MSTLATTPRPRAVGLAALAALAALLILGTALVGLGFCWGAGRSPSARAATSDWSPATARGSYCANW